MIAWTSSCAGTNTDVSVNVLRKEGDTRLVITL